MKDISFILTREPDSMSGVNVVKSAYSIVIDLSSQADDAVSDIFRSLDYSKFEEDTNLLGYSQKPLSACQVSISNLYIQHPFSVRVKRIELVNENDNFLYIPKNYFPRVRYNYCSFDTKKFNKINFMETYCCEWK